MLSYAIFALLLLTVVPVGVYSMTKDALIGWMMKASFTAFLILLVVWAFLWVFPGPTPAPAPIIVR